MPQQLLWLRVFIRGHETCVTTKNNRCGCCLRARSGRIFAARAAYNTSVGGYYLENFGCRATQADGGAIERELLDRGMSRSDLRSAEVAILNTCTVTAAADADARAAIRRIHRENPGCKILVTGCYAQRAPEEIARIPGVSWVIGNSHKTHVAEIAADHSAAPDTDQAFVRLASLTVEAKEPFALVGDIFAHTELMAAPVFESVADGPVTRPNIKVQDGCDNRCSFCVIPFVRGQSRSLRLDSVLREVDALAAAGYREIVISGINLGRWGRDFDPPQRFEELLREILEQTAIERIRISSVEPMDWTDELIELIATSPRICKHAHVPLQSGSDRVLRRMHRKYRPWHYAERIAKIRRALPDAAIGADVMVGFPGETDELFEESRRFIASLPFTYLHVFTYSARPGTKAAAMPDHVPLSTARGRNRVLRELTAPKNQAFRSRFLGRELEAITLQQSGDFTEALSNNFLKLRIAGQHDANRLLRLRIIGFSENGLLATV
jgi:threonylcarbamoyladenosine tRNA methylthiotransferase MtaB